MTDIMAIALSGLHTASRRLEESAVRVASDPQADLAAELVEQKLAAHQFTLNVSAIKTADRMMKSLLDILA